ncbi:fructosamine kinase family protein [Thioflexithrix psekupsensis]|uniref:Fructosamine kinase family protein n=1 Tax=Thioflexithrix psekupsensis TaxID=1570016 RepID=A0A251X3T3_9GAMM|nr:fructosamine kinase family protein [Thioflexithrix psekupsensis]OUD12050.1 hypothetical protein TPSD3_13005 [Thioflexithrix psekupsensis]
MHRSVNWQPIEQHLSRVIGYSFQLQACYPVAGGCINSAYRIESNGHIFFIKLNEGRFFEMFAAEAAGLAELAQPGVIKVPMPLCWGTTPQHAYLIMDALTLRSDNVQSSVQLGHQLAVLHQVTQTQFGWYRDNYIGSTLQINTLEKDWITFWQKHRLGYQLRLAATNGYQGSILQGNGEELLANLAQFFTTYSPVPSLLHGDLWSGNSATDTQGLPVIFDPAVYYGDRETDLAMTELFSGYSPDFYAAYQARYPLDAGYSVRKHLYNLYHVLNHLNIFGGAYLAQAERMLSLLLSELRG